MTSPMLFERAVVIYRAVLGISGRSVRSFKIPAIAGPAA
jgi:hypothetical protein